MEVLKWKKTHIYWTWKFILVFLERPVLRIASSLLYLNTIKLLSNVFYSYEYWSGRQWKKARHKAAPTKRMKYFTLACQYLMLAIFICWIYFFVLFLGYFSKNLLRYWLCIDSVLTSSGCSVWMEARTQNTAKPSNRGRLIHTQEENCLRWLS